MYYVFKKGLRFMLCWHFTFFRFKFTATGLDFLKKYQINGDSSENVIFCSSLTIDQDILNSSEIHCDGTFKIVPNSPKLLQLFTIHCVYCGYVSTALFYH